MYLPDFSLMTKIKNVIMMNFMGKNNFYLH